ncbi:hypothetical protein HY310_03405, partial [Candidatus Microgenomates bacterium]|nr:hypothetical protein [Candidatus Microgenomates bacterium]
IIALRQYLESKKRERVKFEAEMDPLIIPVTIQEYYIRNKNTVSHIMLNAVSKIATITPEKTYNLASIFNILPAETKGIEHPLFVVENIRNGIADNVTVEICNGVPRDHRLEYHFDRASTIYEGPFYDFIERPVMLYKDKSYENRGVSFSKNFAVRVTYTSNYIGDGINEQFKKKYLEVYEATVVNAPFYLFKKYDHREEITVESVCKDITEGNIVVKQDEIAYIKGFMKITDNEKDSIYYSKGENK